MTNLKSLSKFVLLFIYCSCTTPPETKYDTSTLNLKGNIKHITESKTKNTQKLDIEFKENRIISITTERPVAAFSFEYEGQQLKYINHRGTHIKPEDFHLALELFEPLFTFNPDSIVKNNNGDPIKIISNSKDNNGSEVYRVEYRYDQFNNWTLREVYFDTNHVVLEQAERTILYAREVTKEEIATWNKKVDSIFSQCKIRSELGTLIDTTIDKNKERLKLLAAYTNKYYNDARSTDTVVKTMVDIFDKTYGRENLLPVLQKLQKKLKTLYTLALLQRSLYSEVNLFVPLLACGKKTVKDTVAPFSTRYTLTYTFEVLSAIKNAELTYVEESDHRR